MKLKIKAIRRASDKIGRLVGYPYEAYKGYTRKRRETRDEEAAATASLNEQQDRIKQLSGDALGRYKSGAIHEDTQAGIDRRRDIRTAQMNQSLGSAGISDSSTAVSGQRQVENLRINEMDKYLDNEFTKTMTLLGLSGEAADVILSMNRADQQTAAETYASTMLALTTISSSLTSKNKDD